MFSEIIGIYAIVEDLLKATGHQENCRIQMSDESRDYDRVSRSQIL